MGDMVIEHIEQCKKQYRMPQNIIFYRDGVGFGQKEEVINRELKQIYLKLQEKYEEKAPKINYLIITKRIDDKFATSDMKNLKPGTIILDDVVENSCANFFMVSTQAEFGTVVPTHYEIILN